MQNKDYPKLLNCPFCGGEAEVMDNADEQVSYRAFGYGTRGYPTWYKCYCTRCGAMGEISRIEKGCEMNTTYERWAKERAIEKWNTRIPKERGRNK